EIALDPQLMAAHQLDLNEIMQVLEENNANTGSAYIEKNKQAWFIRSEGLVTQLEELEAIPVKTMENGGILHILDIATVHYGHAVRYGALTRDTLGEVTGGIVMMLKGANSYEVIDVVKERIASVEKSLPRGVKIRAYLDRSELINRAIGTVQKNLLEGALIVIFVLILFLGNLRAGLIVASVIPLSLLFAVSMMRLFGISGNLMSLGAIDFGLVVDGSVIIVEATMHHLTRKKFKHRLSQAEMDEEVFSSGSRIRNAAAFGEIIILIVYLPILTLQGVEGKMFQPMAQTVAFAILGAFLMSLTYVPVVSALALSRNPGKDGDFAARWMEKLSRHFQGILSGALRNSKKVLTGAVLALLGAFLLFQNMGSEFLPQLDEGDFAVEMRGRPGMGLQTSVHYAQEAARIILKEFPDEVKEVVGKIGTSEIPTDPMPLEATDMMILLRDKSEWTKADSREELAELMQESLSAIPGINFGFQQPIQMRFNELMTGVKQDVAVKIYGEDLEVLDRLAGEVSKLVSKIEGAEDLYREEVSGARQWVIQPKRDALSRYGLHVNDINQQVEAAVAGIQVGKVYEGEKGYSLVIRMDSLSRQEPERIRDLKIRSMQGLMVPLSEVADIGWKEGPIQIQREGTQRRIIVGFNVRGRDVSSVVKELQEYCDKSLSLPAAYRLEYGGQFENLQEANQRLMIAVPVALLFILLLLYLSFNQVTYALIIFSAIPLASVGGVLALWLRDMPFSISAGIGFIALFGVAVLNGIVLMAEYQRRLKTQSVLRSVVSGTLERLRPVLMTASVASLGFLPMALATSAGAEVQKPLATVVIGGLISSTLLTLLVLPVLFLLFQKNRKA
ncbi:MAG: CusA/CzcA family heavy metal efflux RND transporter, partial [Bacteroidota bacterium]|nr:CusA/CzcA family heavy metal efflux RND transporter [Bacteroidota bacterium]MDX5431049.1 CusA/CzcA family heavy metal efflux RND transporter [Bacteroidota bacterium]MDX5469803.1 CusA/CzcA family heavy metal efflux RND transporter [Bacteroidota bacterium]